MNLKPGDIIGNELVLLRLVRPGETIPTPTGIEKVFDNSRANKWWAKERGSDHERLICTDGLRETDVTIK